MPFLIALAGAMFYSTSLTPRANAKTNAVGNWGGEHVILEVSKKGAVLEFDCARGQIDQPLILDKKGHFDVRGTFSPEHGGPVQRDETTPSNPAHYSGEIKGDVMTLKVVRGEDTVGTFTLKRGAQPVLRKCL